MKILVVNGSPKGDRSVTLRTAQYLERLHREHSFTYIDAGFSIRAFERDFASAKHALEGADLVMFAYPVYTFLAPAQLHRFVELMKENGVNLDGKAVTQITTSKHFYDTTAHAFIEQNMRDMGASAYEGLSADMSDLLTEKGRLAAESYFRTLLFRMNRGLCRPTEPVSAERVCTYIAGAEPVPKSDKYTVALLTCFSPSDVGAAAMAEDFEAIFPYRVRRIDLWDYPFKGGCLGCLQCSFDGTCVYKDGFQQMLREQIDTCDGQIFAFPIRDHFTYSKLKTYNDRQFCNGHRAVNAGSPVGYILAGDYSAETNLRTLIEARAAVGQNFLAGVATDEKDARRALEDLSASMAFALENKAVPAENFYGAGGSRIFRDLVYGMQGMMRADHQFFKERGMYDSFPQKDRKTLWGMKLAGGFLRSRIGQNVRADLSKFMVAPYDKILHDAGNAPARTVVSPGAGEKEEA